MLRRPPSIAACDLLPGTVIEFRDNPEDNVVGIGRRIC